jgi:hypothetical protein
MAAILKLTPKRHPSSMSPLRETGERKGEGEGEKGSGNETERKRD